MLVFNKVDSPYNGIIQRIEQEIYGMDSLGKISGNAQRLGQWTTSVNLALTDAIRFILQADGRWQWDDNNHTNLPIITTNIVSGQKNYNFVEDEDANLILDIYNLSILDGATETEYTELPTIDAFQDETPIIRDDSEDAGTPRAYDKLGSSIFFDIYPDYNATDGIKAYVSREGVQFLTSDTDQKPGIDARFHEYLVVVPALNYAMTHKPSLVNNLYTRKQELEQSMMEVYSKREKDEESNLTMNPISYK